MLKIRGEQLDVLEKNARRLFHEELRDSLRSVQCDAIRSLPDAALFEQMAVWHERALTYGISSERALGRYLGLHLTLLPDFDQLDPVKKFLTGSQLSGDQKMAALHTRLRDQTRH